MRTMVTGLTQYYFQFQFNKIMFLVFNNQKECSQIKILNMMRREERGVALVPGHA